MKRSFCVVCLCSGLLSMVGCSSTGGVRATSIDINKSIEEVNNEVLLLNIVREYKHKPIYFTEFTQFNGTAPSVKGNVSQITFPFGGDIAKGSSAQIGLTNNVGVTYQIGNLNTNDFYRGMMTPLQSQTFKYYWDMRWNRELILRLFINRVRLCEITQDGAIRVIRNLAVYNDNPEEFDHFIKTISRYPDEEHGTVEIDFVAAAHKGPDKSAGPKDDSKPAAGAPAPVPDVPKAQTVDDAAKNIKFLNSKTGEEYTYVADQDYVLTLDAVVVNKAADLQNESEDKAKKKKSSKSAYYAVIDFRSPESMLYLIGQNVGASLDVATRRNAPSPDAATRRKMPLICSSGVGTDAEKPVPMFFVRQVAPGEKTANDDVAVEYDGETYAIPKDAWIRKNIQDYDRSTSMDVLTLMSEIIGQYKSMQNLPTTQTVRLIQ